MTTLTADRPVGHTRGPAATHLIRSEYLKIRTTNTWWIFGLGTVAATALALLVNMLQAHYYLKGTPPSDPQDQATYLLQHNPVTQAANIFTSGQFFGGMFVMVLAILMITNEYYHQTATSTFLTTPHRTAVVLAKFVAAMVASVFFWLITTVLDLIAGTIYFNAEGIASHLGDWAVIRAILINLLVFALWAVFGVGIGVLIRSQIGATVTATLLYVVGTQVAGIITFLIHQFWIKKDWVLTMQVLVPARAAEIAVSPTKLFPQSPPEWVGAAVLVGYGIVLGLIGTSMMRNRDIS
ncbi:MAG TPA: ABC transporter permease [Rugosimonospora sp.]|nr:ABC transporter permease [Rugosimonospora sp.]